ncbi:hypothetical protein BHE74_00053560, partial [Ensete ventricosum]
IRLPRSILRSAPAPMATANSALANGCDKGPSPGRLSSVYSEVQTSRLNHPLRLPSVLKGPFKLVDGPPSSAAGNPGHSPDLFLFLGDKFNNVVFFLEQGGFDMICSGRDKIETPEQIYSEMIGNVMTDARSTGKYYHCELIMF